MLVIRMLTPYIGISVLSFITLYIFRKVAHPVGLVDKPNERKQHIGAIPLVGGLTVFSSLCVYLVFFTDPNTSWLQILACLSILTFVGVLDDKFDISYKIRFFVQICLSIIMMTIIGLKITYLGDLIGVGSISFGFLGYIITVLAVLGAINAFNMVDGIDGLLGGLSVVTFGALAYLFSSSGQTALAGICIALISTLIPYVMMNLGLFGKKRKVFMGDSGSMVIGFTAIWLLLEATQVKEQAVMRPVTALWLIALPLMDMAAIMVRRVKRGDSPFKPDREHLHHIFQRAGLNSHQTLTAICTIALTFAAIGIIGENLAIPEYIMFGLFLGLFGIYYLALAYVWRLLTFFRRLFKKDSLSYQQEG